METAASTQRTIDLAGTFKRFSGLVILAIVAIVFSVTAENFLSVSNLSNVLLQTSIVGITAIGMAIVMLTAGIDLSVGSVAALAGAIAAGLMSQHEWPVLLALIAGLGVGLLLGAVNGILIVVGKLPPFIATLAMLGVARGLTLVYTEGKPIAGLPRSFTDIGSGSVGPIPTPIVVWLTILIAAYCVLNYSRFGLHIYAVGGNEETSRLAGVIVGRIKISAYSISGMLAAVTGLLLTSRLWSAQPQMAVGLELEAIAAAVLGGVSLFGGVGSVVGACIGALIVGAIGNGLNLMRVPSYYQQVIKGVVFILAVLVDIYSKRERE